MDAYTNTQMLIVRQIQQDRFAEAETARRIRADQRPPVPDAGRRGTGGWPRRAAARFRALAWG